MTVSRRQLLATGSLMVAGLLVPSAAMAQAASNGIIGLGWYIRRTANSDRLAQWYGGVLRLPLIRGRAPTWFFWAGDTLSFELKSEKPPLPQRWTDPATAPTVPVFRSVDMDASMRRLKRAGARIVGEDRRGKTREVFLLDPDNQLVALREVRGYRARPEGFNPGVSPMPADMPSWDWTIRRVPDVEAELAFYRDLCGFPVVRRDSDRVVLNIGGVVGPAFLEIAPGGSSIEVSPSREDSLDAIIVRVADHDAMNARLRKSSRKVVNEVIDFNSAKLTYAASPAGHLIGFEERFEPSRYKVPRDEFLEDREANRRWRERKAS